MAGIGVALADGHALVRQALCALLRNRAGLYVVVEAGSVTEAMASASVAPVDLVVYDPCTVPDGGREAIGRIRRGAPTLRLVVLTGDSRESSVRDAVCAGARAYALKSSGLDALLTALREASAGRYWFDAAITRRDPEAYAAELCSAHDDPCRRLTAREREVMRLVAAGAPNAQIAARMGISHNTVGVHRGRMMKKLDLHSAADVVRFAVRHGLLSSSDAL